MTNFKLKHGGKTMTTENRLIRQIMDYWKVCAYHDMKSDYKINKLVYDFAISLGIDEEKLDDDVELTVRNMSNSQKRRLYKLMLELGIK